ncbi:hypothetical protein [Moorena sp. SIO3B2]|uniref:hypothetical protein n=1 Tax=Moorena sp. SIO3B2 TaxID=2607827 RepID=UPI0013CA54CA|nr:hypothetical protein [Moorena sp. SIO3B2]NEP33818.1 hypothetical protein [Moorena sp. SIO3B2]
MEWVQFAISCFFRDLCLIKLTQVIVLSKPMEEMLQMLVEIIVWEPAAPLGDRMRQILIASLSNAKNTSN